MYYTYVKMILLDKLGEKYYLLGYNMKAVGSWGCLLQILLAKCFHTDFLLGLFFDSEGGGDMFLRNVG
jgi:hypothetical protein